jgi:Protein of unknown function (DUF1670)
MSSTPDFIRKKFGPLRQKNLKNALAHQIGVHFPRIGPRLCQVCAEMVLEFIEQHLRPKQQVPHGSLLWMAVSRDDPPRHRQRIADTDLVPVVLALSTPDDIQRRIDRVAAPQRLLYKALRLCEQAYAQGGLLSNCDLAELLSISDSYMASLLAQHERRTRSLVPRRATLHDVGTGLTHKRIICWKRYAEGKDPHIVARETYHSLEAVDRYLGQYDRVRHCRLQGMSPEQTAHALACSLSLVHEYLDIDTQLDNRHA